jgi:hypothetical protein
MILLFDKKIDLYRTEKEYYEKSLQFAKELPDSTDKNINFHLFWRVPMEFGLKQASVIKSIIVSHKNKLDLITINLWSNVDLSENKFFKEISKYVNLRIWDMYDEIKGTILENCVFLKKEDVYDSLCYLEGDLFRLLVLHKYGGFYIDMDVLVLRDLSPLNSYEFLYQWGPTGFKCFHTNTIDSNLRMNGAIMRLNKNSDLSLEFLEILSVTPPSKNVPVWGSYLYSNTSRNSVLVLPCIWFNSEWGYEGTTHEPFKKHDNIDMFDGAFTWHWHNRWEEEIQEGSKFQIIQSNQNKIFKSMINYLTE